LVRKRREGTFATAGKKESERGKTGRGGKVGKIPQQSREKLLSPISDCLLGGKGKPTKALKKGKESSTKDFKDL